MGQKNFQKKNTTYAQKGLLSEKFSGHNRCPTVIKRAISISYASNDSCEHCVSLNNNSLPSAGNVNVVQLSNSTNNPDQLLINNQTIDP